MSNFNESRQSTGSSEVENPEPQPSTSCDFELDEPPVKRHLNVEEVRGMWNLVQVFRKLGTREQALSFAEERRMIPATKMCHYHKKLMKIEYSTNKTVGSFVCNKGPCRAKSKVSRGKGTWFENLKITMSQVFYLMYAYSSKWSYDVTIKEDFSEKQQRLSNVTINDWFNCCRESVVIYQIEKQIFQGKIGGPGKVVQIDESKFKKGQRIKGHWVLGMIEDGSEDLRLEICLENVRSADVLVPLIQKHVAQGTTIHTDCWQAYEGLENYGYIHKKVNPCDPKNPFMAADGTHIQRIESQWRVVKQYLTKDNNYCNRENFSDFIFEYLWRRNIRISRKDPFEELIKAINYVYKQ